MNQWLVTMGDFESSDGIVAEVGWKESRLQLLWSRRYKLPSERRMPGKGFTGAELLNDGTLVVCGFNAIYHVDPGEESYPKPLLIRDDLNDLHDVFVQEGAGDRRIIVANTGLDRIETYGFDGTLLHRQFLSPLNRKPSGDSTDPYFDELSDPSRPLFLRKLRDQVHPNSLLEKPDGIWVSRFSDRAVGPVSAEEPCVQVAGCPHDLVSWRDRIWFTTTDGRVWSMCPSEGQHSLRCELDSFEISGRSGWVRGLALTDELLILGFTRITRMPRERWAKRPFDETATGLLAINSSTNTVLDWLSLSELGQHPKIFGIYTRRHS